MSQFYASIQGNRGEATRQGTKKSGISGHIRGWNIGVEVICTYDEQTGKDSCRVWATGGSNHRSQSILMGDVELDSDDKALVVKRVTA